MWSTRKLIAYGLLLAIGGGLLVASVLLPEAAGLEMYGGMLLSFALGAAFFPTVRAATKLVPLALAVALVLGLTACGSAQPVTTACRVRAVTCEACERVCEASEGLCDAAAEVDEVPPAGGDIFEE